MALASFSSSASPCVRASSTTKSLPSPCILMNGVPRMAGYISRAWRPVHGAAEPGEQDPAPRPRALARTRREKKCGLFRARRRLGRLLRRLGVGRRRALLVHLVLAALGVKLALLGLRVGLVIRLA